MSQLNNFGLLHLTALPAGCIWLAALLQAEWNGFVQGLPGKVKLTVKRVGKNFSEYANTTGHEVRYSFW